MAARRVYKLRFSNSTEFEDWRKSFGSRCIALSVPSTATPLPLKSQQSSRLQRSESFKGNHSFEYLKEHVVSSAESTASTASMLTASTLSMGGASTVTANLLTALSRQQSNLGNTEPVVDMENTKRYARSLRVQEKVYGCGMVFKYEKTANNANATNAPKQKRILLLTDVPRIIFIDPIGNIARGNIELLPDLKVEAREVSRWLVLVVFMNVYICVRLCARRLGSSLLPIPQSNPSMLLTHIINTTLLLFSFTQIDQSDFEVLVGGASNRFSVADERDTKVSSDVYSICNVTILTHISLRIDL
ncbi:hypothetical protein EON64_07250 [archaeon]|nr:MAG: hypothetical protein EON64_07250 [archaeon]